MSKRARESDEDSTDRPKKKFKTSPLQSLLTSLKTITIKAQSITDEEPDASKPQTPTDTDLICTCDQPLSHSQETIDCIVCNEYYHLTCIGLNMEQANMLQRYICGQCRGEKGSKKCVNCGKSARTGSKYCSHECGIAFATEVVFIEEREERVRKEGEKREKVEELFLTVVELMEGSGRVLSEVDERDLKEMFKNYEDSVEIEMKIEALYSQQDAVNDAIDAVKGLKGRRDDGGVFESRKVIDVQDCVTCGRSVHTPNFPNHANSCFSKKMDSFSFTDESYFKYDPIFDITYCNHRQKTKKEFCKNLKGACPHSENINLNKNTAGSVCGCPLSNGELCLLPRSTCRKHFDWEGVKLSELFTLQYSHEHHLEKLRKRNNKLKKRIISRWLLTK